MSTRGLCLAPRFRRITLSMPSMETLSVADVIAALCQLSCEVLSAWSQVHNISACEVNKAAQHDLMALQGVLYRLVKLVTSTDNRGEAQDRSGYFSASMREELPKLIRMSDAFLDSAEKVLRQNESKKGPGTMGLPLECWDIRTLLLQWKTILLEITEADCFPPERTKELEIHSMTITSLQTLEESAPENHIPGVSTEMQHNCEKTMEHERGAIAIVGMSCLYPGGAVDTQDFWSTLALGGKSPDTGGAERCLVKARSAHRLELFHLSKEPITPLDELLPVPSSRRSRMISRVFGRAVGDSQDLVPSVYQESMVIDPEKLFSSRSIGPLYLVGHCGQDVSRIAGEVIDHRDLKPTHPPLARNTRRKFLSRYASGLTTAVPAAFLSGLSALCMHNSVANRLGEHTLYFDQTSVIFSAVSNPSPPLIVVATFVHGISTLAYYYLRPTDKFREGFIGAGIVAASVLGLWSRIDVESLLLGVLPIVITGSLFLCTLTNAVEINFGLGDDWRRSQEFDLEKQTGI